MDRSKLKYIVEETLSILTTMFIKNQIDLDTFIKHAQKKVDFVQSRDYEINSVKSAFYDKIKIIGGCFYGKEKNCND